MRLRMTRLTLLYALLFLTVVWAADTGHLPTVAERIQDVPYVDKVIHFLMFGLLSLGANLSLADNRSWSPGRAILTGSILVAIVATLDEGSNLVVANRSWSLGDLAANYAGVLCMGVVPLWGWRSKVDSPVV